MIFNRLHPRILLNLDYEVNIRRNLFKIKSMDRGIRNMIGNCTSKQR